MQEWLLFLNEPIVLWSLMAAAIGFMLIDFLVVTDWPAYVGFALLGTFFGATVPVLVAYSGLSFAFVLGLILLMQRVRLTRNLARGRQIRSMESGGRRS